MDTIKFMLEQKGAGGEDLAVVVFPAGGFSVQMVTEAVAVVAGPGFSHRVKLTGQQVIALKDFGKDADPVPAKVSGAETAILPRLEDAPPA